MGYIVREMYVYFLMRRRPPRSTRTDTLFPDTTLFRSALGKERGDLTQLRPDLVVIGIDLSGGKVRIKVTPVEVKCRPTSRYGAGEAVEALAKAKALSSLLSAMQPNEGPPVLWALSFRSDKRRGGKECDSTCKSR